MIPEPGQRIDKWLWYARFFKTRSLAAKFTSAGKVRVTKGRTTERVNKISHIVRVDDVLTFALGRRVRVIKILSPGARRGPAPEAQTLYKDLTPEIEEAQRPLPQAAGRESGQGRPTKKERRALDRLKPDLG